MAKSEKSAGTKIRVLFGRENAVFTRRIVVVRWPREEVQLAGLSIRNNETRRRVRVFFSRARPFDFGNRPKLFALGGATR